jgi:hypothetical protein
VSAGIKKASDRSFVNVAARQRVALGSVDLGETLQDVELFPPRKIV